MMPILTVVTPAYNEADDVRQYLDSLTRQTFCDFELLFIDDGSTDNTVAIVDEYKDRLRINLVKMNRVGWKSAKARGTAMVRTELCIVNDADTIVDPTCFANIVKTFDDPSVAAVGGHTRSYGTGWVVRGAELVRELMHTYRKGQDNQGWVLTGFCMAFRTEVLREVGGLIESHHMVGQDVEISWRLQRLKKKVVIRDDAIVYHHEPETLADTYRRQHTFGRKAVHTYWLYRNLWTNWKLWIRFYPLVILLTALVSIRTAVLMVAATFAGVLWLFRKTDATRVEKIQGWIVFTVHSIAYTVGFVSQTVLVIGNKLRLS